MRCGRQGPVGMGGWLAVFVGTLVLGTMLSIGGAIWQIGHAGRAPTSALRHYALAAALVAGLRAAGNGFLAWLLYARRDIRTPRIVIAGLWLLAGGLSALLLIGAWTLLATPAVTALGFGFAFRPLGYAAIRTAYLLRSDRFANTCASPGDHLAAVFG